jgi:copper transport protein
MHAKSLRAVAAIAVASALIPILALMSPQMAYGHAVPVSYSIDPNAVFDDASSVPSRIAMSFSERPDPRTSYIRLLNAQNERIDNDDFAISTASAREASVTIDASKLQDDTIYSVSWRTLSLDDGHITEGAYVFGIGDIGDIATAGGGQETRFVTSTLDALLKWPLIVAQTAIVGGAFGHLFFRKSFSRIKANNNNADRHPKESDNVAIKRLAIIITGSSVAIAGFATALLFLQASNLATSENSDYFSIFQSLLSGSPSGSVWMLRIASSAAIIALATGYYVRARKDRGSAPSIMMMAAILVAGAASIFSNSMLSHNSAAPVYPELAIFTDWVHFMAVSIWVGGLFYFSTVAMDMIRATSNGDSIQTHRLLSLLLPRFSILAIISLGIIGITGIYMAWIHVRDFDSLFQTAYGTSLIIKLSSAAPMVALGGYHQLVLHKNMVVLAAGGPRHGGAGGNESESTKNKAKNRDTATRFGKTVKIESIIGIGVLLAASFLTITSPPSQAHHEGAGGSSMGYLHTVPVDGTEVTFAISPFQVGVNTFTVMLKNEAGQPPANIQNVFVRFTNTQAGIGPIIATLEKTDEGTYSVTGAFLSQQGTWKIDLIAQRIGEYDLNHSFEETLGAPSTTNGETHSEHEEHSEQTATPPPTTTPSDSASEEVAAEPPSEAFTLVAIVLVIGIAGASAYSVINSRKQLKQTMKRLNDQA